MALLRNEDTGIDITRFITLEEKQSVVRTEWQTLDGRTYLQRYGEPNATYEIVAYVNYVGKQLLFDAEDTAALLKAQAAVQADRAFIFAAHLQPNFHRRHLPADPNGMFRQAGSNPHPAPGRCHGHVCHQADPA